MTRHYGDIAFTPAVGEVQSSYGSAAFFARRGARPRADTGPDALTEHEREFLSERDSFYLATVGETGWPYVQFRGGPEGFLRVLDEHTVGWADFRGNQQYISTGNLSGDERVAMIAVDYARRRRLKLFGRAHVTTVEQDPVFVASLAEHDEDAVVERAVLVSVEAFDWNCPQHIPERFTVGEIAPLVSALQEDLAALRQENDDLRNQLRVGRDNSGQATRPTL